VPCKTETQLDGIGVSFQSLSLFPSGFFSALGEASFCTRRIPTEQSHRMLYGFPRAHICSICQPDLLKGRFIIQCIVWILWKFMSK